MNLSEDVILSIPYHGAIRAPQETKKQSAYKRGERPDKLRPTYGVVRPQPDSEYGSGPGCRAEWWRGCGRASTPLSSL